MQLTVARPVALPYARAITHGLMLAVILYAVGQAIVKPWEGGDAHAYWAARGALYGGAVGGSDAYFYSPAFAQLLAPLQMLPWQAFHVLWAAMSAGALVWLIGPWAVAALILPVVALSPFAQELVTLNVHLLMAVAVVVGFRYPAAWALILLTKVTPGIGLLWFAARGEWRNLGIALGATALIAGLSFAFAPGLWFDWIGVLSASHPVPPTMAVPVPLLPRLAAAALIVVWGARTDRRWTVVVAVTLSLPALWWAGLSVLAALGHLQLDRDPRRSGVAVAARRPGPADASGTAGSTGAA